MEGMKNYDLLFTIDVRTIANLFNPSEGRSYAYDIIRSPEVQLECKQTGYSLRWMHKHLQKKPNIARCSPQDFSLNGTTNNTATTAASPTTIILYTQILIIIKR